MKSPPTEIFGIPLHNYTPDGVTTFCIEHLVTASSNTRPVFINLVTATDLSKQLGWLPSRIKNPELLHILRNSSMNLPQGKALRWISAALGTPLKPAIDVQALLVKLCTKLGAREKAVFIVGDNEKIHKAAAVSLHEMCPGLRLVGIATSPIYVQGDDLTNADERDGVLIEQINATNTDLLILALEKDKQAIWFERVRKKLKVPLVIFVGSALNNLTKGKEATTNKDRPHTGIKGFWKNTLSTLKILWMALPLIAYHHINQLLFKLFYNKNKAMSFKENSLLFLSPNQAIATVTLPQIIDTSNIQELSKGIEDAKMHSSLILDFRQVRHIQPEGFYMLINHWKKQRQDNRKFYGFCPSNDIILLMQLHRTWDYFKPDICMSIDTLMTRISPGLNDSDFFESVRQTGDLVIVSFLGTLDSDVDYRSYLARLIPVIGNKNCLLDFSYCNYIDSPGFTFLLKIRQLLLDQQKQLSLCSLNKSLINQFKLAKVADLFRIV